MNLSELSLPQLRELDAQVAERIKKAAKRERELALEQIFRIAHGVDLTLADLLKEAKAGRQAQPQKRGPYKKRGG
jgi:hypothetical protein